MRLLTNWQGDLSVILAPFLKKVPPNPLYRESALNPEQGSLRHAFNGLRAEPLVIGR